jgi:hypothetical protein
MKLWLLTQKINAGYDTFDSCVVAADTREEARKIHPDEIFGSARSNNSAWCKPEDVVVEYIGRTDRSFDNPVICASFNAG